MRLQVTRLELEAALWAGEPRVGESDRPLRPSQPCIAVDEKRGVSGLMQVPKAARACYVLAHGTGAGMSHPFMTVADGLAERGVATLRFQFPYMAAGSGRQDTPKIARATARAAVGERLPLLPAQWSPFFSSGAPSPSVACSLRNATNSSVVQSSALRFSFIVVVVVCAGLPHPRSSIEFAAMTRLLPAPVFIS